MRQLHKKGNLDNFSSLITGIGGLAILIAVIFLVIGETKTQVTSQNPCNITTYSYNSVNNTCCVNASNCTVQTGLSAALSAQIEAQQVTSDIPGWLSIVIITIVGGVLLLLVRSFRGQ